MGVSLRWVSISWRFRHRRAGARGNHCKNSAGERHLTGGHAPCGFFGWPWRPWTSFNSLSLRRRQRSAGATACDELSIPSAGRHPTRAAPQIGFTIGDFPDFLQDRSAPNRDRSAAWGRKGKRLHIKRLVLGCTPPPGPVLLHPGFDQIFPGFFLVGPQLQRPPNRRVQIGC